MDDGLDETLEAMGLEESPEAPEAMSDRKSVV